MFVCLSICMSHPSATMRHRPRSHRAKQPCREFSESSQGKHFKAESDNIGQESNHSHLDATKMLFLTTLPTLHYSTLLLHYFITTTSKTPRLSSKATETTSRVHKTVFPVSNVKIFLNSHCNCRKKSSLKTVPLQLEPS